MSQPNPSKWVNIAILTMPLEKSNKLDRKTFISQHNRPGFKKQMQRSIMRENSTFPSIFGVTRPPVNQTQNRQASVTVYIRQKWLKELFYHSES